MSIPEITFVIIGGLTMLVCIVQVVGILTKYRHLKKHIIHPWYDHIQSYEVGDPEFWLKHELSDIYRMESERRNRCFWWDKKAYKFPVTTKEVKLQIEAEIRESPKEDLDAPRQP